MTARPDSWLSFGAGRAGFSFVWAFRGDDRFSIELFIDTKDRNEIKTFFAELKQHQREIDSRIPDLNWEELPESRASRIAIYKKMPASIKKLTSEEINELIRWAISQMDIFRQVFPSYIDKLEK